MTTLCVTQGPAKGQQFELEEDVVFVGRGAKNDIQINDHTVSRMHLKIFSIGTAVFVEDLKSSNGTLIAYAIENAELSSGMSMIAGLSSSKQK